MISVEGPHMNGPCRIATSSPGNLGAMSEQLLVSNHSFILDGETQTFTLPTRIA